MPVGQSHPTGSSHRCEGTLKDLPEPDEELLENARRAPEGDYQAFERLVHRHQKVVGQQGTLRAITATHTILEQQERSLSVSNATFLDSVARQ